MIDQIYSWKIRKFEIKGSKNWQKNFSLKDMAYYEPINTAYMNVFWKNPLGGTLREGFSYPFFWKISLREKFQFLKMKMYEKFFHQ